jgi:sensor c-di-GMP phosphodiesterase-like protein
MPSLKQRVLVTLTIALLASLCGVVAGYLLGRAVSLYLTERRLSEDAGRGLRESSLRLTEARAVAAAMDSSPFSPCSDAELTYFRALIFESKYLKDAGRMIDGKIDCSASLDRLEQPLTQVKPDISFKSGAKVYKDLAPYRNDDTSVVTLQRAGVYIVIAPFIQAHMGLENEHYAETVRDDESGQVYWMLGERPSLSLASLARQGRTRSAGSLYLTQCSSSNFVCVTAYASIAEVLRADRLHLGISSALGALAGALLGLLCSFIYRNSRGMEQQLRRAIRRDELRVVYQPIVDPTTRRIVGAEALARWTDEEGFVVSPDVFVAIAEERGFVGEITRLVLRHILRDFGEILRNHSSFRININVAAADLADPKFLPMLERALDQAGIRSQRLGIELTESCTARQQVSMDAILHLRQSGHSVYIDDFGTGYSSLAYLQDLAVDAIKIDRAFTQAIGTGAVTVAILPQILALAGALNLQVVVEGIETAHHVAYFAALPQPVLAQGWFYGRPVPAAEFLILLSENEKAIQLPVDVA